MNNAELDTQDKIIKIKGKLDKKFFPKNKLKNGDFGILSIKVGEELEGNVIISDFGTTVIKGCWCEMDKGQDYTIVAKEVEHPTYGRQYELLHVSADVDFSSEKTQKTYLESFLTEKQVKALYDGLFNPFEAIEKGDVNALCSVKGIGESTANRIIDKYKQHLDYSEVLVKLDGYGLTQAMVHKLVERYGSPSIVVGKVKENVYILADEVDGIGFKRADEIAIRKGMNPQDPKRVRAFTKHYLGNQAEQGNSWVYTDMFFKQVCEICGEDIDRTIIQCVLRDMLASNELWTSSARGHIGLMRYFKLEEQIFYHLQRLSEAPNKFQYGHWQKGIEEIEEQQGWKYTDEQKAGVKTVLDSQVVVVTGLAGTGKSTITNAMIEILKQYQVRQCALSGRASQRMMELNGVESNTIHKTFGYMYGNTWLCNEDCPLDVDILILDEASMVNGDIFLKVVRALRTGTKVIIIGDYGQLPTIGNCNVFLDMIEMDMIPVVKLTVVHRQAQASAIISKSIDVRNRIQLFDSLFEGEETLGELQDLNLIIYQERLKIKDKMIERFMKHYEEVKKNIMKVQVVVPMKTRGSISARSINETIQPLVNESMQRGEQGLELKDKKFFIGDKIINNTNKRVQSYKNPEEMTQIFNGNIGIIKKLNVDKGVMLVDFGELVGEVILDKNFIEKSIELAYAITCHKLQGSSAERVVVGLDYSAYQLLSCEWVYTAITRGEDAVDFIAENKATRFAISNTISSDKQTFLKLGHKIFI